MHTNILKTEIHGLQKRYCCIFKFMKRQAVKETKIHHSNQQCNNNQGFKTLFFSGVSVLAILVILIVLIRVFEFWSKKTRKSENETNETQVTTFPQ